MDRADVVFMGLGDIRREQPKCERKQKRKTHLNLHETRRYGAG
jgi:hypothetical protein